MTKPEQANRSLPREAPARTRVVVLWAALLLAVFATYSNHFHNSFHFDDSHTVEENAYIRSLRHVPALFTDARTSTPLPQNQIYRPLVTFSLALDYWMAGGLNPFWFHVSTFLWFLVLLACMYALYVTALEPTGLGEQRRYVALFATAWYGLHPVAAETVNYVYQRGDLYATLGIVAGLVVWARIPSKRRWGLYFIPVLLALLAKQTGLMFAPLLLLYIVVNETDWPIEPPTTSATKRAPVARRTHWPTLRSAVLQSVPAFVVCGLYYFFQKAMTPSTWAPGGSQPLLYWYSQPFVLLRYTKAFFLPTGLSADTDRGLLASAFTAEFIVGILFLAVAALTIWLTLRRKHLRPIAFGLAWFFVASLPTSLLPLAEVENDHRMFLPFVGLALAVAWSAAVALEWLRTRLARGWPAWALTATAVLLLAPYAYGARVRNEVWRTEESLWKDVTIKSPRNGRGLMNYGLKLMEKADYTGALEYFTRAESYTPNYSVLQTNLGIAYGAVRNTAEAERHFHRAMALAPDVSTTHFYYGRWLKENGRLPEAITELRRAIDLNPDDLKAPHLLMRLYFERDDLTSLKALASTTLGRFPEDAEASRYANADPNARIRQTESAVKQQPSPEGYLNLSLYYEQAGRHQDCIQAAREALKLRPEYPEAYNNIAAAFMSLKRWDEAIDAAQQAVRLRPDFQLAQNNLRYAREQKALEDSHGRR